MMVNGKRIIRVFPQRTSHTPVDDHVYIGDPPFPEFLPQADEAHVSVTFTWDRDEGVRLAAAWGQYLPTRMGGPAFNSPAENFTPGLYLKEGITITSRGCPRKCKYCLVPEREGKLWTLPIQPGFIVQDNNLLAAPRKHIEAVFEMLSKQKHEIIFSGGLDATKLTVWMADQLNHNLRIRQMFFAYDRESKTLYEALARASELLDYDRRKKRCYVLCGFPGDTVKAAEKRLESIWALNMMPFAMAYRGPLDRRLHPDSEFRALVRRWRRPIAMYSNMGEYDPESEKC